MATLDFPSSPTLNQEYSINGRTWKWNGTSWVVVPASLTETDPTVPAHVKSITTTEKANWDTAYGWGDHSTEGYLTSFTETDPTVPAHVKSITTTEKANWDTAYGWGDHSTEGYATEIDDLTDAYSNGDSLAVGVDALSTADPSTSRNHAFGHEALSNVSTGSANTAFGWGALERLTTGGTNTGVGLRAGYNIRGGGQNVAIGNYALQTCENGYGNMAIGAWALRYATGNYNAAIGYNALTGQNGAFTGANNVGVGYTCGTSLTTGQRNILFGTNTGFVLTTGQENTIIGHRSGFTVTTGSNNTLIGAYAETSSPTASNEIVLGDDRIELANIPALSVSFEDKTVNVGDWTITDDGLGNLLFSTGGANKMKLTSSGDLEVVGSITAGATL